MSGRAVTDADRRRLLAAFDAYEERRPMAVRDRALVVFCWSSAIRISEACAVRCGQVAELGRRRGRRTVRVYSDFRLTAEQAKGGVPRRVVVPRAARRELGRWIRMMLDGNQGTGEALRVFYMSRQAAWEQWQRWQALAGIARPYRLHDLRHTAATRFAAKCNGDPHQVAAFTGHRDIRHTLRYVQTNPSRISELAEDL